MEIAAKKLANGLNLLEIGPVSLELNNVDLKGLSSVIKSRLQKSDSTEAATLEKKLLAYRNLASKMRGVDDRVVQKFIGQLKPEQLVTLVRLSGGKALYLKILKNLSKQNGRQFEEDYLNNNKITEHQACVYMETIVPFIKRAAQEQKMLDSQG